MAVAADALLVLPPPPAEAHRELTAEQSLALVKIFVNSSIACICYSRGLLEWSSDCFRKRFIADVDLNCKPEKIYDNFCHVDSSSTEPSQEIRVLVRSSNKRANSVLDTMAWCPRPLLSVS
jgi:hypothetical protein